MQPPPRIQPGSRRLVKCVPLRSQVKNDVQAHRMDLVMEEFLESVVSKTEKAGMEGYVGAARLVCKSEWDYKIILKFADLDSLKEYMGNHHEDILKDFRPQIEELAVDGKMAQQNFVCASSPRPPPRCAARRRRSRANVALAACRVPDDDIEPYLHHEEYE